MMKLFKLSRFLLMLPLALGGATFAQASEITQIKNDLAIWNPNSVTWTVAANSDVDDVCQIHWLYDDEIDVFVKKNSSNLYYFGIDYLGSKKHMKELFNQGRFEAILVANEDQINLGSERVEANQIIAIAPKVINSIDALREAKALFLKSEDALYSFPLENANENFDVYEQCLKDNGQYSQPIQLVQAPDAKELNSVISENTGQEVSNSASVASVSAVPLDAEGADLLFGNSVAIQQANVSEAGQEPALATEIVSKADGGQNAFEERASKRVSAVEENENVMAAEQTENFEDATASEDNQDVAADNMQEEAPIPRAPFPERPKTFSKSPSEFLDDDLAYADGVGQKKKSDTDGGEACPKGKVDENITGVIENLTRKLGILEREKEALRVKMIAGQGDGSVVSDILACKTDGASEEILLDEDLGITQKYEVLIDDMTAEIENLKIENELLNAAVSDAPSLGNIDDLPKTAALNDKVNNLEVENLQLKREINEFKKMIEKNVVNENVPEKEPESSNILKSLDDSEDDIFDDVLNLNDAEAALFENTEIPPSMENEAVQP